MMWVQVSLAIFCRRFCNRQILIAGKIKDEYICYKKRKLKKESKKKVCIAIKILITSEVNESILKTFLSTIPMLPRLKLQFLTCPYILNIRGDSINRYASNSPASKVHLTERLKPVYDELKSFLTRKYRNRFKLENLQSYVDEFFFILIIEKKKEEMFLPNYQSFDKSLK